MSDEMNVSFRLCIIESAIYEPSRTTRELSTDARVAIATYLSLHCDAGALKRGAIAQAARKYQCHRHTVENLWRRVQQAQGTTIDFSSRKKGSVGRKKHISNDVIKDKVTSVPLERRSSLRTVRLRHGCRA